MNTENELEDRLDEKEDEELNTLLNMKTLRERVLQQYEVELL